MARGPGLGGIHNVEGVSNALFEGIVAHPGVRRGDRRLVADGRLRAGVGGRQGGDGQADRLLAAAVDILRSYNSDTETSEEFFQDKESVLTGDYNAAIDHKIADIKQTCGI
jgi:hypothetical protein